MGLGRALTLTGFAYLSGVREASTGMLYAEADNEAGIALYRSLGFETLRELRGLSRL